MNNVRGFIQKHPNFCIYGLFPLPLWIFFVYSVYAKNIDKNLAKKQAIRTDIKVVQGDTTIDDPFAYFDDKEANEDKQIDYSGKIDLSAFKEKEKQNYEDVLKEDKAVIEEQNKALYKEYNPRKREKITEYYSAEDIVSSRKQRSYEYAENTYRPREENTKQELPKKEVTSGFNQVSSSGMSSNTKSNTSIIRKIKVMAVTSSSYRSGNSIKFKLLENYNENPKGTVIIGNIYFSNGWANITFPGSQLDETNDLELYNLNNQKGIPLAAVDENMNEMKDDIKSSSSSTVGDIVRSVPIIGGSAERMVNRIGNKRTRSITEVQILAGEKFYIK